MRAVSPEDLGKPSVSEEQQVRRCEWQEERLLPANDAGLMLVQWV